MIALFMFVIGTHLTSEPRLDMDILLPLGRSYQISIPVSRGILKMMADFGRDNSEREMAEDGRKGRIQGLLDLDVIF